MGFFARLKKKFSSDVEFEKTDTSSLISPYELKKGFFKMGANLLVPEGFELMVVHKQKMTDVIKAGEYQISPLIMPNLGAKLEIWQGKEKNNKRSFTADAYFVRLGPSIPLKISNYRRLKYSDHGKTFFVKFQIDFTVKIDSLTKFSRTILPEYKYLKDNTAENFLKTSSTFLLTEKLDKENFSFEDFTENKEKVETWLKSILEKDFISFGVKIESFTLSSLETRKKDKKEIKEKTKEATKIESSSKNNDDHVVIPHICSENPAEENNEEEVAMYDDEIKQEDKRKFVDLSLDSLYDDDNVVCPSCGAKNRKTAIVCYKCGNDILKIKD